MSAIGTRSLRALASEKLAHVRASAQALIAGAALRGAGDANAIAHLHAAHFRTDGFDNSDAAVALNQRHAGHREKRRRDRPSGGAFFRLGGRRRNPGIGRPSTSLEFE